MNLRAITTASIALTLLLAACSSAEAPTEPSSEPEGSMSGMPGIDEPMEFAFGEPGDPASSDRSVDVALLDELRFEPSAVDVESGETITFVVTNEGQAPHEFVLGSEDVQEEHEMAMGEMDGSLPSDEPNAIALSPGETKSLTWTFSEPGQVLYGCHIPGHYIGGMVGTITVSG